jgi:hypothetical protein
MDPWCDHTKDHINDGVDQPSGSVRAQRDLIQHSFQDSFQAENGRYEPLPDSTEYINLLETKLRNITSGAGRNKDKHQHRHREQALANLLRSDSKQVLGILTDSDLALDRELDRNQLISRIIPKQPLTAGETVQLVNSDILDQNFAKNLEKSDNDGDELKGKSNSQ